MCKAKAIKLKELEVKYFDGMVSAVDYEEEVKKIRAGKIGP